MIRDWVRQEGRGYATVRAKHLRPHRTGGCEVRFLSKAHLSSTMRARHACDKERIVLDRCKDATGLAPY